MLRYSAATEFRSPISLITLTLLLCACGETAKLPVAQGFGPNPQLPPPVKTLIPTVNIAPANPWPDGKMPVAAV